MHFSIDRTVHTTAFDKPVVDHWMERKIAQTAAGSTEKDRSDNQPLQRRARYRLSYIPLRLLIVRWVIRSILHGGHFELGARCSSVTERSRMVRWVIGSILHGGPLELGARCSSMVECSLMVRVCGIMHIKEPLLLIGKSRPCGSYRFPLSLSVWLFTICLMPYNRKYTVPDCRCAVCGTIGPRS